MDQATNQIIKRDYARTMQQAGITPVYCVVMVFKNKKVRNATRKLGNAEATKDSYPKLPKLSDCGWMRFA
jgi:hypothetical protein